MKLSIVIPLYNKELYIGRCLDSLLNQDVSSSEYEIIIINDGSTDTSGEIAQNYVDSYENIYLRNQQNVGLSATRNNGLEIAKGDYIYFLDADDYLAHNVLNDLLEIANKNQLEILGFRTKETQDGHLNKSLTNNFKEEPVKVQDGLTFISDYGYRNEVWWYMVKKKFLLETGIKFVEGRYIEDSIFTSNLFVKANKIAKTNKDVHRFVKVKNSIQTSTNNAHMLKFIHDLVYAIEELDVLIKNLDSSHKYYNDAIKSFKRKQQSYAFTLFIKAFRCDLISTNELDQILNKLNKLEVYPIDTKLGGIGGKKTSKIYSKTVVPVLNNKVLLYSSLKIKRLISLKHH